ncbi:PadR family transcriptional regulator [Novosphingobium sp. B1]|uniref:PadR family transcriptional regulator n=1 Tax=Novosphingobium sp. B1 TaxID=1938756 RepID=UPI000A01A65C|nr:PadR family transcriptional regulator [Novosphingobium sp. B1]
MKFEHRYGHHGGQAHARRAFKMMAMMGGRFGDPFDNSGRFGGDGPFGGGRGRGGGRRGGRMFAGGELRLLLLHLVAEQPRHGYDLIRAISEMAGGEYAPSPGVVYPTLSLLVDEDLIAEEAGEGPRKAFAVTGSGRAELAGKDAELEAIIARLKALSEQRNRADSPPVRRAMGNLHAVLRNRMLSQGVETETAHAIADILDEAARRIERL